MAGAAAASRMAKEVRMLASEPPPGVWAAPRDGSLMALDAQIQGPPGTAYAGGVFRLVVDIPQRYPFEPPKVRFTTPIYHPNIDPEGRICLDTLNMPPKGAWKPALNVATVLASVGLLLAEPNPDDGLVTEITAEFRHQRPLFDAKAREWTRRYAMQDHCGGGSTASGSGSGKEQQPAAQAGQQAADASGGEQQQAEQQAGQQAEGGKENNAPGGSKAAAADDAALPAQPPKRPRLGLRK